MTKIITVLGATGIQGGSVVSALLENPSYSIRAITRNSNSDAARALAGKGVEVVEADVNDVQSLKSAFEGSYAIFAVTNFFEALTSIGVEKSMENETRQGRNLADAAAATGSLEHYIWSTLPNSKQNSGGKFVVPYYESKNSVDAYIKTLPQLLKKTTFLWIAWYSSNIMYPLFRPSPYHTGGPDKSYLQFLAVPPSTYLPMAGDEKKNAGLWAKAILEQPGKTRSGKFVAGIAEPSTFEKVLSSFAAAHNVQARCIQIGKEDYSNLWPVWGELLWVSTSYLAYVGDRAFTNAEERALTKEDLGIDGLAGVSEAFSAMPAIL